MKKILFCLTIFLISLGAMCQSIDTVFVRNLSFSYEEWKWLKGGWQPSDSLEKKHYRKIENAVNAAGTLNNNTQINVDSLKGTLVLRFYAMFQGAAKGETRTMSNDIRTKIRAYPPILIFCDGIDADWDNQKENKVKNGKDDFNKNN